MEVTLKMLFQVDLKMQMQHVFVYVAYLKGSNLFDPTKKLH